MDKLSPDPFFRNGAKACIKSVSSLDLPTAAPVEIFSFRRHLIRKFGASSKRRSRTFLDGLPTDVCPQRATPESGFVPRAYIPISDDDEYHGRADHALRSVYTPAWKLFFRNGMKLYIKRALLRYGLPIFEEMVAPGVRYLQSLMGSEATNVILL